VASYTLSHTYVYTGYRYNGLAVESDTTDACCVFGEGSAVPPSPASYRPVIFTFISHASKPWKKMVALASEDVVQEM